MIFSFFFFAVGFSYVSTFLPFVSIVYGQRQANYFYNSNKDKLRLVVKKFEELRTKGLWTIIKQNGDNDKIQITINDTSIYYVDINDQNVDVFLGKHKIDKSQLNSTIDLFKRINIVEIRNSGADYIMVAIKEVFPYYLVYLNFCISSSTECINYNIPAHVDNDVYFQRHSNP